MRRLIGLLTGARAAAPKQAARKPAAAKRAAATKQVAARRSRRRFLRDWRVGAGLGAAVLAAAVVGGGYLLHREGAFGVLGNRLIAASADLGLRVADVEVEGRVMTGREAILHAIGVERGTPILAISPAAAKAELEALPWVRSADVERRLPDTLHIRLVERTPFAFWQRQGKLVLIDRDGTVITGDRLDRFPGLIVTVGDDAPKHVAALMDMLSSEPELARKVVAAVRVGGRRWNIHFANGVDVKLPEVKPTDAWAQLAQLNHTDQLLARDIQMVDMRLPDRLVVRVPPAPPKGPTRKKGRQAAKST